MQFGIIGFGYTGKQHARALEQLLPGCVTGVVEVDPERRSGASARVYHDYQALLADPNIDAVTVCLPHFLHEKVTAAALEGGKHVLVEKPLAMTVAAGERLCELATRSSRVLMVEMTHRFMPPVVEARKLIQRGEIGKVLAVDDVLIENIGLFGSLPQWMYKRSQSGGGVGLTSGVHMIDHVAWLTGEQLVFDSARFGYSQALGEVEDTSAFFLHLASGVPVHILLSWRSGGPELDGRIQIYGDQGTLRVHPWRGWELESTGQAREETYFANDLTIPERVLVGMSGALSEFIDAIQDNRKPRPAPEESLLSQRIIEQAYAAAPPFD